MNCKSTLLKFFFLVQVLNSFSQSVTNTKMFLSGVLENNDSIASPSIKAGWLESLELRTDTDEFLLRNQEYQLRISPNLPVITKKRNQLLKTISAENNRKSYNYKVKTLTIIYNDWLQLKYLLSLKKELLSKEKNMLDQQLIISKNVLSFNSKPYDVIAIEKELIDLKLQLSELEIQITSILNFYNFKEVDLVFSDLPSIEETKILLENLADNFNSKKTNFEQLSIEKEIELEKVIHKDYLDFFRFNYSGPHTANLENRLSVGVAFKIPISDNSKFKIKELQLKKDIAAKKFQRDSIAVKQFVIKQTNLLFQKIKEYREYQIFKTSIFKKSNAFKSINSENQSNISFFQLLKIEALKNEVSIELLKKEIVIRELFSQLVFKLETNSISNLIPYLYKI